MDNYDYVILFLAIYGVYSILYDIKNAFKKEDYDG